MLALKKIPVYEVKQHKTESWNGILELARQFVPNSRLSNFLEDSLSHAQAANDPQILKEMEMLVENIRFYADLKPILAGKINKQLLYKKEGSLKFRVKELKEEFLNQQISAVELFDSITSLSI